MEFSKVFKKVSGAAVTTLVMGLFALFNLGLLFFYSWTMALVTALLLGVLVLVTGYLLGGLLRFETSIHRIDGVISGLLLELLGGIITLRTAGAERRAFARWAGRYTERLVLAIQAQAVREAAARVAGGVSDLDARWSSTSEHSTSIRACCIPGVFWRFRSRSQT